MARKLLSILVVSLALVSISQPGRAVSVSPPNGFYDVDGSAKLNAKFPGIITVAVTLSDLGLFGATMEFDPQGGFVFSFPSDPPYFVPGTWEMTSANKFEVALDLQDLISALNQYGAAYGITATLTSALLTGQVNSQGSLKGNFNVAIEIGSGFYSSTLTFKGAYTATPSLSIVSQSTRLSSAAKSNKMAETILKFFKALPIPSAPPAE